MGSTGEEGVVMRNGFRRTWCLGALLVMSVLLATPAASLAGVPSVTINQAPGQGDPTNGNSVVFSVVFGEPVGTFSSPSDVNTSGTTTTGTISTQISGSGANYTVTVTGMTSNGFVTASIPA